MVLETQPWDAANYLDSPETMAFYLEAAFEDGDAGLIAAAIGDVARAKGIDGIADRSDLPIEELRQALSEKENASVAVLLKVMKAIGLKLSVAPAA